VQRCETNGHFVPIGSHGFYSKKTEKARFDQQPIEACATVSAYLQAYRATGKGRWRKEGQDVATGPSAAATLVGSYDGRLKVDAPRPVAGPVFPPASFSCRAIGLEISGNRGAGFDGLLVEASFFRFSSSRSRASRSEQSGRWFHTAAPLQAIERFEPGGTIGVVAAARSRADQSLRQSGIGSTKARFQTTSTRPNDWRYTIRADDLPACRLRSGRRDHRGTIEVFEQTEQGECAGARLLNSTAAGTANSNQTACGTTESGVKGSSKDGAQAHKARPWLSSDPCGSCHWRS